MKTKETILNAILATILCVSTGLVMFYIGTRFVELLRALESIL